MPTLSSIITYRLVEHAGSSVLVLAVRTIDEAVAQHMIVYAAVSALPVGYRAGEPLHAIHGGGTLCNKQKQVAQIRHMQRQSVKIVFAQVRGKPVMQEARNFSHKSFSEKLLHTLMSAMICV